MIADIANELRRVIRELCRSHFQVDSSHLVRIPEWMIEQGLRVEVNEYDLLEAWHRDHNRMTNGRPPTEIMGVRLYLLSPQFADVLPERGWRIINPFVKPSARPDYRRGFVAPSERG